MGLAHAHAVDRCEDSLSAACVGKKFVWPTSTISIVMIVGYDIQAEIERIALRYKSTYPEAIFSRGRNRGEAKTTARLH